MRRFCCVRDLSMAVQQCDCGLQYYATMQHTFYIQENIQKNSQSVVQSKFVDIL